MMIRAIRMFVLVLATVLFTACSSFEQYSRPQIISHTTNDAALQNTSQQDGLRVMTLNMAHARGSGINQVLQGTNKARSNLDNIVLLLKQEGPDIVSLQEADRRSFWNGNFDHVSFLAENGGFQRSVSGTHVSGLGLDYGTALVANLDLNQAESVAFSGAEVFFSKGFVVSSFRWPGVECIEVDVVSAHLDFASGETRREQAAEIIAVLKQRNRPIILMGDFNSDWQRARSVVRQMADGLNLHPFNPGASASSLVTFPKFSKRLDWILVSSEIHFNSYRSIDSVVSDHLGVVSDLSINRSCG
jgi:endonuclease/exonuclease/phosphatase family metal-dependent hydrolase